MHIYNWYHSNATGILYIHEYRLHEFRLIPLLLAFLYSPFAPIRALFTYLEPSFCDRIRPPRTQVARKLTSPFPSPGSYTPPFQNPDPPEFPRSKYTFIRTTLRTWLTRSSTVTISKCTLWKNRNN
jgi:hypothetical protein